MHMFSRSSSKQLTIYLVNVILKCSIFYLTKQYTKKHNIFVCLS